MSTTNQESKTQIDQDRAEAIVLIRQGIKKSVINNNPERILNLK